MLILCFLIGIGSSVLHPEASRITFLASGGKRGLAQSLFQVGGNFRRFTRSFIGSFAGGSLMAESIWPFFAFFALAAIGVMYPICKWYKSYLNRMKAQTVSIKSRSTSLYQWIKLLFLSVSY